MTDSKRPEPWNIDVGAYETFGGSRGYIMIDCEDVTEEQITILKHAPVMLHEMKELAKALEDVHELPDSFYAVIREARGL